MGRDILEFGMYDAIVHFNMGSQTVVQVYEALGVESGKYTRGGCKFIDAKQVEKAECKEQERNKKRRKILRGQKKKKKDKKQQVEGVTFAAGHF